MADFSKEEIIHFWYNSKVYRGIVKGKEPLEDRWGLEVENKEQIIVDVQNKGIWKIPKETLELNLI